MREFTIKEAVQEVLSTMANGSEFHGPDFHRKVLYSLMSHGSSKRPMDSSTTRELRRNSTLYGVKCIDHYTSKYKKCIS